jgi:hypothetical protein
MRLVLGTLNLQSGSAHYMYSALPCVWQRPCAITGAVKSGAWHRPVYARPPCLTQRPRAFALVVQAGCTHLDRAPPPCLTQRPRAFALVVQPGCTHTSCVPLPFVTHRLCAAALVVHPGCLHFESCSRIEHLPDFTTAPPAEPSCQPSPNPHQKNSHHISERDRTWMLLPFP